MAGENGANNNACKLGPFVRNRYFFGKPLTVDTQRKEQNYFNDKRHLLNRLVNGSGIVWGLEVTKKSNTELGINPGVALDSCGREIVIGESLSSLDIKKLVEDSGLTIDGGQNGTPVYLCLRYCEAETERVSNLATRSTCEGEEICEANLIREGAKVVLKPAIPPSKEEFCTLLTDRVTLYQTPDDRDETPKIKIERIAPHWVKPREIFQIKLVVTAKASIDEEIAVEVTERLPASLGFVQSPELTFLLNGLSEGDTVEKSYLARAVVDTPATAEIEASITIGTILPFNAEENSTVEIVSGSISEKLVERYFQEKLSQASQDDLEQCFQKNLDRLPEEFCICVAKLTLKQEGQGIVIDGDPEPIPQAQYVYNNMLLYELIECAEKRIIQIPEIEIEVKDDAQQVLPSVTALNFGNGIQAEDGGQGQANISVNAGDGLTSTEDGIEVSLGDGLSFDNQNQIAVSLGDGLSFDEQNQIFANLGNGLTFDEQDQIAASLGDGLTFTQNGQIIANLGNGLSTAGNGETIAYLGAGLTFDQNGQITANLGNGLTARNNKTVAYLGDGLTFDDNNRITANLGNGLTYNQGQIESEAVTVQANGGKPVVGPRSRLNFTGSGISVSDDQVNNRIDIEVGTSVATTGRVIFEDLSSGELRLSPPIEHHLAEEYVPIVMAIELDDSLLERISFQLVAIYDPDQRSHFRISIIATLTSSSFLNNQPSIPNPVPVRWWALPTQTSDQGDVTVQPPGS